MAAWVLTDTPKSNTLPKAWRGATSQSRDGRWQVVPDGTASYKTRVIVHLPKDPDRFNGILLCEWANVSTFNDISNAVNERFHASGYAYAARLILPQWTSRDLEVAAICLAGLI
jgi:hypothetical protein